MVPDLEGLVIDLLMVEAANKLVLQKLRLNESDINKD